jgi:hypothetical protein
MVLALETIGRAQVDRSSGKARTNIDLPRGAFDLQPKTQDVVVPPAWRDVERDSAAGKRGATVRFACDAGVVATPPLMGIAQGDPRNHGIAAGMRIHFDENTRKIEPVIPFVRRVVTKVQIIDYSEAR